MEETSREVLRVDGVCGGVTLCRGGGDSGVVGIQREVSRE
jgi:hypothetical protein